MANVLDKVKDYIQGRRESLEELAETNRNAESRADELELLESIIEDLEAEQALGLD